METADERNERRKEARLRAKCKRNGIIMRKSRAGFSSSNFGEFRLVDAEMNAVIGGENFDMTLDEIEDYFKDPF